MPNKQNLIFDFIANTGNMIKNINQGSDCLNKFDKTLDKLTSRKRLVDGLTQAQRKLGQSARVFETYTKDLTALNRQQEQGAISAEAFKRQQSLLKSELASSRTAFKSAERSVANYNRQIKQAGYDPAQVLSNPSYAKGFARQAQLERLTQAKNRRAQLLTSGQAVLQSTPLYSAALGSASGTVGGVVGGLAGGPVGAAVGTAAGFGLEATGKLAFNAAKSYGDFEKVLNTLVAVAPEAKSRLKEIEQATFDLGQKTIFTAMDVAIGYKELAKQGFATQEFLDAMPGLLNAAAASEMDLATTTDIVAGTLRGFGLQAKESMRVADVLAKAAAVSAAGIPDLGEAMKQVAPIASITNQGLTEMASTLALLSNNMVKGMDAGTDVRSLLLNLAEVASPATKKQMALNHQLAGMGVKLTDGQGKLRPFLDLMKDLGNATRKLPETERLNLFGSIAGKENIKTMGLLTQQTTEKITTMRNELTNASGASKKMADQINQGMTKALGEAGAAAETARTSFGKLVEPEVIMGLQAITGLLNGVSWALNGLANMPKSGWTIESIIAPTSKSIRTAAKYMPEYDGRPVRPTKGSNPLMPFNALFDRPKPSALPKANSTHTTNHIAINIKGDASPHTVALIKKEVTKAIAQANTASHRLAKYDTQYA